jgi:hypothetical protein
MRTSAHLYPSSILVRLLLELLGPRFCSGAGTGITPATASRSSITAIRKSSWTRWHSRLPVIWNVSTAAMLDAELEAALI